MKKAVCLLACAILLFGCAAKGVETELRSINGIEMLDRKSVV